MFLRQDQDHFFSAALNGLTYLTQLLTAIKRKKLLLKMQKWSSYRNTCI